MEPSQPPWPRYWLMTDERIGERLWNAIASLPSAQGGIVYRHYSLSEGERLALGRRVAEAAKRHGLLLSVAVSSSLAEQLGAAMVHTPRCPGPLPFSRAVHDEREARAAREEGAALVFVSPIHPTRSHPQATALGGKKGAELAVLADRPAIALGGMDHSRFRALGAAYPGAFHGFAGIDCWLSDLLRT